MEISPSPRARLHIKNYFIDLTKKKVFFLFSGFTLRMF